MGMKRFVAALILAASAVIPSRAALVEVGLASYDQFIPQGAGPGVNAFDVLNLTGAFALPPDAPVDTPLTFQNLMLSVHQSGGGTLTYSLGSLDPGVLLDVNGNPVVQVPDSSAFTSATLSGTISPAAFVLNGTGVTVSPASFTATILPSSGHLLQVGDSANILINVVPSHSTSVPEPASIACFGLGLLLLASRKLRKTALLLVSAIMAQGAVTLTSVPAPSAAQPGVTTVTLTGNGFPIGTILPSGVTVTMTPVSSGPVMTATVQSVFTAAGAMRRVAFNFTGANVTTPTAYTVRISGATTANVSFASSNAAQLAVNPPAAISLNPGGGTPGASLTVGLTGTYTNFLDGATQVSFGTGITVNSLSVSSPTTASASITISAAAATGPNSVVVSTGAQRATSSFIIQTSGGAPVANAGPNSPAFYNALFQLDGSGSSDPAGRSLTYRWTLLSKPSGSNSAIINPATAKPTLPLDQYGAYVVQLVVNNGVLNSSPSQITITVAQNGAPTLNAIPTQTIALGTTMNLRLTATDPDPQDTLTYYVDSAPQGAAFNPSPVIQWTPTSTGQYPFSVHVADSANHTDAKNFIANVVKSNGPPKLGALSDVTIPLGSQFQQTLTATTPNPGDTLTYSLLTGPDGMTLSGNTLSWTPTSLSQVGTALVKVQVTNSENQSDEGDLNINVTAVLPPVAQNDHFSVTLNNTLTVPAAGVLANDSSPNNTPLSAILVSGPDKGTLSSLNSDGSFSYSAPANYPGPTFSPVQKYEAVSNVGGAKPPLIVDLNKDGKPDMVAFTYETGLSSPIYGINGTDGSLLWTAPLSGGYALPVFTGSSCTSWGAVSSAGVMPAAADLDGDGYPEIVFAVSCGSDTDDGGLHGGDPFERYIALSGRDGSVKWVSEPLGTRTRAVNTSQGAPSASAFTSATIAVLQPGETPSLVVAGVSNDTCDSIVSGAPSNQRCRYVVILDGATGKVRRKMYSLASEFATRVEVNYAPLRYPAAIVYDLKGDGNLEIVAGGSVFDAKTGAVLWENTSPILGTALANLDGGSDTEVIMVDSGSGTYIANINAYKADGTPLWTVPVPTTTVWGSPTAADINQDGFPEVMISVYNQLWAISHDGQILWISNIPSSDYVDDGFHATAYDLDNTGVPKVLLQSRQALYFLNGTNGNIEYSLPSTSFASFIPAWPTVADLGGDGHAKVVVQASPNTADGPGGGYFVYQAQNKDWRPVHYLRSQWADFPGTINDDGSVPYPQGSVFADLRTNVYGNPAESAYASNFIGATQTEFTYMAAASGLQSQPATVTIDLFPDNRPPQFTSIAPTRFQINVGFTYQAVAVDPDLGDTVTYSLALNDPGNCNIDTNSGLLSCGPNGNPWERMIIVATDNHGASSFQTLNMSPSTAGTVPSIVGQTIDSATNAITLAGYRVGTVTQIFNSQPAGTVLSQVPAAGTSALLGELIRLTVSQGPAPVVVPDVVGESLGQANTALSAAGFTGVVTPVFSNTIPAGQVISQSPAAGTLISPGLEDLTVSAGNGLYLKLAGNVTSADTPLAFTVTAHDVNGNTTAAPPLQYTIASLYQPYAGSLPTVSGNTIVPASNTLGTFTITATDPATGRSVSSSFAVTYAHHQGLPSMMDDYGALTQAIADINDYIRQLRVALAAKDTAQMSTIIGQMVARWKQVDIGALKFDNPMAVDQGFPPTAEDLPGLGLTPSADDILYSKLLNDADAKLQAWIAGLKAPDTTLAQLSQLADDFNTAAAKIEGLQITEWGGVNAQSTMTAILSQHIAAFYDALMNEMAKAAANNSQGNVVMQKIAMRRLAGRSRGVHLRPASTLAEVAVTTATQFIVDKVSDYFSQTYSNAKQFTADVLGQAAWAAAATALAQHLRSQLNGQDAATVAGASLSFHVFNSAPSFIECDCDIQQPNNNQVYLIGPDILTPITPFINAVQSAVNFRKAAGSASAKNFDQVKKAFDDFRNKLNTLAASLATAVNNADQPPNEVANGCVILGAPCGEIIYDNGFTSVYTYTPPDGFASLSGLPVPIIVLVYDSATGAAFFDTPVFFPTKQ